jgi:hypothetical protein
MQTYRVVDVEHGVFSVPGNFPVAHYNKQFKNDINNFWAILIT